MFRRLKEVAKISALAQFLVNEGVAIDQASVWAHPVLPLPTPSTTPGICVSGYGHRLYGGVDMGADRTRADDDNSASPENPGRGDSCADRGII